MRSISREPGEAGMPTLCRALDQPRIDDVESHLRTRLHTPLPRTLVVAVRTAIELTAAEQADLLVEMEDGPNLAAGTIVEMFDLDRFVEPGR